MPTTLENMKEAFAGESQANQKYRAFAKKAEKEGFPNIARLFRTTAEAERIHAEGHLGFHGRNRFDRRQFAGGNQRRNLRIQRNVPADGRTSQSR